MSDCAYPHLAPSTGYGRGCRCETCAGWRRAKDLEHRERLNAYNREQRRLMREVFATQAEVTVISSRSATTFYNDILDRWDG